MPGYNEEFNKVLFRNAIQKSVIRITTFPCNDTFKDKPKQTVLDTLDHMLVEEAINTQRDYYIQIGIRVMAIVSAIIIGVFTFVFPWLLPLVSVHPTQQISGYIHILGIIIFCYSFVLHYSLDMPDEDLVRDKFAEGFALRVLDYCEERIDQVHAAARNDIKAWLTPQERQDICDEINKAIIRLQSG